MFAPMNESIQNAVDAIGGKQAELARRLSQITGRPIKQQHIWNWINRGDVVPAELAIPIEQASEGHVTRYDVRPDIYPRAVPLPKPHPDTAGAAGDTLPRVSNE